MDRYRVVFFLINRLVERLTLTTDKTKNSPQNSIRVDCFFFLIGTVVFRFHYIEKNG